MTFIRRDAWSITVKAADRTWPAELLWYARGVRALQAKPISDPTSWRYQSAIHGLANTPPPPGAPWNECQHATWYFTAWHRMYLAQFEQIIRAAIVALHGPNDWALPYWNYERSAQTLAIPPAFTAARLPDGSSNPLLVQLRRQAVNVNRPMPAAVASSVLAMSDDTFTSPPTGEPGGFGGPRTGFAHFGPFKGDLEAQPHDVVHGWVGGLMNNPDTAALDPIFWLHHANIDRLWETWRIQTGANPTSRAWLSRKFRLRSATGGLVQMAVEDVVDAEKLGYTYDALPAVAAEPQERVPMPARKHSKTVAQNTEAVELGREGASATIEVGALPPLPAAAAAGGGPRFFLHLADITGEANPDVIYGVYVNLPDDADEQTREQHRVGLISFFGLEQTTRWGARDPQPLSYSFDVTNLVADEAAEGQMGALRVALLPLEGTAEDPSAAAAAAPPINVGTLALRVAHD